MLYKNAPARVVAAGAKIEIQLPDRPNLLVRHKDITFLHAGPVDSPVLPAVPPGELDEACEMLQGETTNLQEFAELVYGENSPASAWAVFTLVQDGLYVRGAPEEIYVLTQAEHEAEASSRAAKARETEEYAAFLDRVRSNTITEADRKPLRELEEFAFGRSASNRLLKELGLSNTPEEAHALLLKLKAWDETVNPYFRRAGFSADIDYPPLESLSEDERVDLTTLEAFAIDDEGNQDPDDAISIDGDRLWIHVADPTAAVRPDSAADILARAQGSNIYLPEMKLSMLPPEATSTFGLGLRETSPALSFGVRLAEDGSLAETQITLSRVRVTRLSYNEAQQRLGTGPLHEIHELTKRYNDYRRRNGAVFIRLPEVKISVTEGRVSIRPLLETEAQMMVTDAMLLAGEAAARFALTHSIPIPFTSQQGPDKPCTSEDLSGMYACRRQMRASTVRSSPAPHSGLGLELYCRATSPLRRYLDLVVHQQIRSFLTGGPLLDADTITLRIGESDTAARGVQKLERTSNLHWTLVYLLQNPGWQGRGIIVDRRDRLCTVILPEIGLETKVPLRQDLPLDTEVRLKTAGVDLPTLSVHFDLISP